MLKDVTVPNTFNRLRKWESEALLKYNWFHSVGMIQKRSLLTGITLRQVSKVRMSQSVTSPLLATVVGGAKVQGEEHKLPW